MEEGLPSHPDPSYQIQQPHYEPQQETDVAQCGPGVGPAPRAGRGVAGEEEKEVVQKVEETADLARPWFE